MAFLRWITIVCSTIFQLGSGEVKASHIAGADIYVDYIGKGPQDLTYRVNIVVYRICENNGGIGLSDGYNYSSSSLNINVNRSMVAKKLDTLNFACSNVLDSVGNPLYNSCINPSSPYKSYEVAHYMDTITLPTVAPDWVFKYESCCRNNSITNLCQPSNPNLRISAL